HLTVRPADGFDEVPVVVALDQVRDGLRIGLGREGVALLGEALLELAVVLDDAVEDDRDLLAVAARERVRILLGDAAVRGPPRMPDPGLRRRAGGRRLLQPLERTDSADVPERTVLQQGHARRVVAAVLEPLETGEQQLLAFTRPYVA